MPRWPRVRRGLRAGGWVIGAGATVWGAPAVAQRHEDAPHEARVVQKSGPVAVTVYEIQVGGVADHALLTRLARRLHALGFQADLNGQGDKLTLIATEGEAARLPRALKPGLVEVAEVLADPRAVAGSATPVPGALLVPDASDPAKKWAVSPTERLAFDAPTATSSPDPHTRQPVITLKLGTRSAAAFADLTERLVGRTMAILIDGQVYLAPKVMERIGGGQVQLHLPYVDQSLAALPALLDGGPITAPLKLQRTWTGERGDAGGRTQVRPRGEGAILNYGTPARWEPQACALSGQPACRIATAIVLGVAP